ncbi:hypothetical protein [Reinekea marinisedimentorum]|uniref:Nickel-dependent hydrogenase n=1 Tax=Reinekea marinisedimentorum TaxID=230495 RepID=A0A4R3HUG9_9GAMM|nr:hypothetical protein [Reinekea marinisedimentorum]TCS36752.1 hypothetical protein BCF53_12226 [Reinekea marinisedimentorum]
MSLSSNAETTCAPSAGHIRVQLEFDRDGAVSAVAVENHRPKNIGGLFTGLSPEQALERIPKLFLLCSQAQQVAAVGAIAKQKQLEPSAQFQRVCGERCALEWLKEHSWQLWQMERELFGEQFAMQPSLDLTRLLLKHLHQPALTLAMLNATELQPLDETLWPAVSQKLAQLFGMAPAEFLALSWPGLVDWSHNQSPYAQLLQALLADEVKTFGANEALSTTDETGAMLRQQHPLLQQAKKQLGASIATRTLARLLELASVCIEPHIAAAKTQGRAEASRGALNHKIRLDRQGVITDYQLDAPTDRLFRPGGLVEQALLGQKLPQGDVKWVRLLVWAIDPCVEFSVHTKHKNKN